MTVCVPAVIQHFLSQRDTSAVTVPFLWVLSNVLTVGRLFINGRKQSLLVTATPQPIHLSLAAREVPRSRRQYRLTLDELVYGHSIQLIKLIFTVC